MEWLNFRHRLMQEMEKLVNGSEEMGFNLKTAMY